jgi:hypothetical protein
MPRASSVASMRGSISPRATPRFSRPKASSSRTESFEPESWFDGVEKMIPTRPRSSAAGAPIAARPAIATLPPIRARTTRGMKPAAASVSVDFPAPLRPATPTISPGATSRSIPARAGSRRPW